MQSHPGFELVLPVTFQATITHCAKRASYIIRVYVNIKLSHNSNGCARVR